ncbi:hypothetical protein N657DRAFT_648475 [Parathielavia appendiculata]|uniref:Secreted protein n=1 Tax=Parathielavia appendiculata TaxID=2587402 RepID=A0AAN6TVR1_9PEZI|nr:hypothetical protein N657DRAFT_648475 [Parathielavia appendiculata]
MRLSTLGLIIAPLVSLATADYLIVHAFCTTVDCNYLDGRWYSAFGAHFVDARGGCRDPPENQVPGMTELCMDWPRGRGHFYFSGQAKRCLSLTSITNDPSCGPINQIRCDDYRFDEVTCTW